MKKLFLLLLFPIYAFGAIDATLGTNCDNEAAGIITALQSAETTYAAANGGQYFSLPATGTTYPADGVKVAPANASTWSSAGVTLPSTVYQFYELDCYTSGSGYGYALRRKVISSGVIYYKVYHVGPETGWSVTAWSISDR